MTDEIRTILLELSKSHYNLSIEGPLWEKISTQITCLLHFFPLSLPSILYKHSGTSDKISVFIYTVLSRPKLISWRSSVLLFCFKRQKLTLRQRNQYYLLEWQRKDSDFQQSWACNQPGYCSKFALFLASKIQTSVQVNLGAL